MVLESRWAALALATVLAVAVVGLLASRGLFDFLECRLYDWRFVRGGVRSGSSDLLIVAIDEKSEQRFGSPDWYQRPGLHARLIDTLTEAGACAVAFDVLYHPPRTEDLAEQEAELRAALERAGMVAWAMEFDTETWTAKAPRRRPSSAEAVVAELEALLGPAGDLPPDEAPTVAF